MELATYFALLRRRWWLIVVTLLVTLGVIAAGTYLTTPTYEASTTLRVLTASTGSLDWVQYDIRYADRLMNTYAEIATSYPILAEVTQKFGLDQPPQVSAEVIAGSELMQITVQDVDPALARDVANALAEILIVQGQELYKGREQTALEMLDERLNAAESDVLQARTEHQRLVGQAEVDASAIAAAARTVNLREETYAMLLEQYEQARVREVFQTNTLSVVEPALLPTVPASPNVVVNLALGVLVGLAGGLGLSFLFENLDTTLHTTAQIEAATEAPSLARIPKARRQRQVALFDHHSAQADAFRRLGSRIATLDRQGHLRTFLVTSAEPQEGKSTTATNLAVTLSESGRRVAVVDCDLHHPALHEPFDLSNSAGLGDVLLGNARLEDVLQEAIPGLWVLTSGPSPRISTEVLGSKEMMALVQRLSGEFDLVLLDAPAFQAVADASVLLPLVDGVLLVVGCGKARREVVRSMIQQVAQAGGQIVGTVVNWVNKRDRYGFYGKPGRETGGARSRQEIALAEEIHARDPGDPAEMIGQVGLGSLQKEVSYGGK